MNQARHQIEEWIQQSVASWQAETGSVEEAMAYSVNAGGKRLRPQLVLAAAEYMGIDRERVQDAAVAVEYLHTYSLIHDDLPAMDNDDMRRGRPTSHKVFGEALAILAGDALLTEAFVLMSRLNAAGFSPAGVVRATHQLARAAGRQGLVRGQVQDLAGENRDLSVESLSEIHRNKTAVLFEACLSIPALLAEDDRGAQVLSSFGRHFGLAFQMVDDILNVVGDARQLGKATGTDAGLGKATYPRLLGMDGARELLGEHVRDAKHGLDPSKAQVLEGLLTFAVERTW